MMNLGCELGRHYWCCSDASSRTKLIPIQHIISLPFARLEVDAPRSSFQCESRTLCIPVRDDHAKGSKIRSGVLSTEDGNELSQNGSVKSFSRTWPCRCMLEMSGLLLQLAVDRSIATLILCEHSSQRRTLDCVRFETSANSNCAVLESDSNALPKRAQMQL
ncbi:uncharacterized protein ARMOST_15372 [Armillaria ostoyae]|uniref:Uncharacterized protein n=1 Tax=Armillaria ostoyae TaxID=47428 RepID=A0A284RT76_ARMOS|nr:uncharacterized protein ARMOST_15372 [Armillaria ostoyae]